MYRNAEDWEIDKGKESGINYGYDCIKYFVETESFNVPSAKFGLDSQIAVDFNKSFSSHINIPKEQWSKYHEPLKMFVKKACLLVMRYKSIMSSLFCLLFSFKNCDFL